MLIFEQGVNLKAAEEIGKKLAESNPNFTSMTAVDWKIPFPKVQESVALIFHYKKINDLFIEAEKLGKILKKQV
jgi:hypothetical protein